MNGFQKLAWVTQLTRLQNDEEVVMTTVWTTHNATASCLKGKPLAAVSCHVVWWSTYATKITQTQ